jgi:hypothetical protein
LEAGFSFEFEFRRVGWTLGVDGKRSPFASPLTAMVTPAALLTGLVNAQMAPAIRQLKMIAAATFFSLTPYTLLMALLRAGRRFKT